VVSRKLKRVIVVSVVKLSVRVVDVVVMLTLRTVVVRVVVDVVINVTVDVVRLTKARVTKFVCIVGTLIVTVTVKGLGLIVGLNGGQMLLSVHDVDEVGNPSR
jgi:hypothetical protein